MNGKNLPHDGVYTRLKPSKIHGVGVFAIRDIPKGTAVFAEDDDDIVWVDKVVIADLSEEFKNLYKDFCILKEGRYGCPVSFDKLTIAWYLNNSDEPNLAADDEYRFHALRDIKAGEELTAKYSEYSEEP